MGSWTQRKFVGVVMSVGYFMRPSQKLTAWYVPVMYGVEDQTSALEGTAGNAA